MNIKIARRREAAYFEGTNYYRLDGCRRLHIPPAYLRKLGNPAIATRGLGGCILVMPERRWRNVAWQRENADFIGFYQSSAALIAVNCVGSGHRICVPKPLCDYAGLEPGSNVALVGLRESLLIAPEGRWDAVVRDFELRILGLCGAIAEGQRRRAYR